MLWIQRDGHPPTADGEGRRASEAAKVGVEYALMPDERGSAISVRPRVRGVAAQPRSSRKAWRCSSASAWRVGLDCDRSYRRRELQAGPDVSPANQAILVPRCRTLRLGRQRQRQTLNLRAERPAPRLN